MVETHLMRLTAVTYGLLLCILVDKREMKHTIFLLFVYDHELFVYLLFLMEIGLSGVPFGLLFYK